MELAIEILNKEIERREILLAVETNVLIQNDMNNKIGSLKDVVKKLTIPDIAERLPIGTVVRLIDDEGFKDFKGFTGELKITGHCSYMGKNVGYLVNEEGIFLIEDFVR